MTVDDLKIWLVIGLVPYRVRRKHLRGGLQHIEVCALFWSCMVKKRSSGRNDWTVKIPLIEKLRQGMWAAIMLWQASALPEESREMEEDGE